MTPEKRDEFLLTHLSLYLLNIKVGLRLDSADGRRGSRGSPSPPAQGAPGQEQSQEESSPGGQHGSGSDQSGGRPRAGRPSPGSESTDQCRPEACHRKSVSAHLQPYQAPCPPSRPQQESTPSLLDSALPGRALAPYPAYRVLVDLWFFVHDPLTQGPSRCQRQRQVSNPRSTASVGLGPAHWLPCKAAAPPGRLGRCFERARCAQAQQLPLQAAGCSAFCGYRCLRARGVSLAGSIIETRRQERRGGSGSAGRGRAPGRGLHSRAEAAAVSAPGPGERRHPAPAPEPRLPGPEERRKPAASGLRLLALPRPPIPQSPAPRPRPRPLPMNVSQKLPRRDRGPSRGPAPGSPSEGGWEGTLAAPAPPTAGRAVAALAR